MQDSLSSAGQSVSIPHHLKLGGEDAVATKEVIKCEIVIKPCTYDEGYNLP